MARIETTSETRVFLAMDADTAREMRDALAVGMGALQDETGERTAELRPAFNRLSELRDALDHE